MKVYHARTTTENGKSFVIDSLRNNDLYLGFGALSIELEDFARRTVSEYKEKKTVGTLRNIKRFKDGDIVFMPKIPNDEHAIICIVDGDYPSCYEHQPGKVENINHRIKLKKVYGLDNEINLNSLSLKRYKGSAFQKPLLNMNNQVKEDIIEMVNLLQNDATIRFKESNIHELMSSNVSKMINEFRKDIDNLSPAGKMSFEKLCREVIEFEGYEYVRSNHYNKTGGDADLVFRKDISQSSLFETGETILLVQVKKHKVGSKSDSKAVEQIIDIRKSEPDYNAALGCVITLADFDNNAIELAEEHHIKLINGEEFTKMLIKVSLERLDLEINT